MKNRPLLLVSASLELMTGIALIASPSLVVRVLLSADLIPSGEAVGRVGGFALLSMAIACWPVREASQALPLRALFLYNLLAGLYLNYLGLSGEFGSFFLFPVGALHVVLAILFLRPAYESFTGTTGH